MEIYVMEARRLAKIIEECRKISTNNKVFKTRSLRVIRHDIRNLEALQQQHEKSLALKKAGRAK